MSEVRIDPAQLAAEADAIAAAAALDMPAELVPPPSDPAQPSAEEVLQGYRMITFAVLDRGSEIVMPNWRVTHNEKSRLADALSQALVLWFPDQPIPPKYLSLLMIAGVATEIASARRDPETGAFIPMKVSRAGAEQQDAGANTQT
jgi:hypothetical protein